MIAAVDNNWAIGKDNQLLYKIPTDMKYFKTMTEGNIVVYGFNTLMSFPQRKILPNRYNIILSRNHTLVCGSDDMCVAKSIGEALDIICKFEDRRDVFICGGSSIYNQFIDFADSAYITKIDALSEGADAFFPNLDTNSDWEQIAHYPSFKDDSSGLEIEFSKYIKCFYKHK